MRAWKKSARLDLTQGGGHVLAGDGIRLASEKMILRHYIFRDQTHAYVKYAGRKFAEHDISRGWHRNRISQPVEQFTFPPRCQLHWLVSPADRNLSMELPRTSHYWQW
jgi:hypothetical protein